jgi:DNA polymerase gamma 1
VFNYGRIYGAGLKFASTLLRQFNPSLSELETSKTASNLYKATKGTKTNKKALHNSPFWRGGTESFVFNKLEEFAEQERPKTPVLGAGITEALMSRFVSKGGFMTSRINWAIQSSGVDYLHLLIISMDYLIKQYSIDARLAITVHDEIRYLVREEDKYRAALALQVSNLWTRAMFSQQMGINDLPQSCAYFSAVDIDHVLRKEVDMDCITPSNLEKIPHGESLDIMTLLANPASNLGSPTSNTDLSTIPYQHRVPVMESLQQGLSNLIFMKAQITADDKELRDIVKEQKVKADQEKGIVSTVRVKKARAIKPYFAHAELMEEPITVSAALGTGNYMRRDADSYKNGNYGGWDRPISRAGARTASWR